MSDGIQEILSRNEEELPSLKEHDEKSPNTTADGRYGNSPIPDADELEAAQKRINETKKAKKLAILERYNPLIMDANPVERAKLTLEMQDELRDVDADGNYGNITTSSMAARHRELLEKPFWNPDIKLRWANTRPDIRSLRLSEGYRDCLTKDGHEVRDGDAILMGMPRRRYEEAIVRPQEEMKEASREAIAAQFHRSGESEHVETFGDIKFDKK